LENDFLNNVKDMLFKNKKQIIENGQTEELKKTRKDIFEILHSVLDAVDPYKTVKSKFDRKNIIFKGENIDTSNFSSIFLVGFGKASVGMAEAVCDSVDVDRGVVITNESSKRVRNECITTITGGHPIPNQNSICGTDKILDVVKQCKDDDLLIVLISGGGSALLCKPRVDLNSLQKATDLLLKSGADINEINSVRKHLSFVKGGQLIKSFRGTAISFIISDIVGDPLESIASGPTYPDSTTHADSQNILKKYDLLEKIPPPVIKTLDDGIKGKIPETLKNDDPVFDNILNFIVANNEIACRCAEDKAKELGYETMLLTASLTGEAREIGKYLIGKARNYYNKDNVKIVFISGGETTVTVKGRGMGGRNQEMVLGSVEELIDSDVIFASFATDGVDGASDAAGAIADGFTMLRANKKKLDPNKFLQENNSYEFFKELNDLFITGPTGTNVMDIQIIIKVK